MIEVLRRKTSRRVSVLRTVWVGIQLALILLIVWLVKTVSMEIPVPQHALLLVPSPVLNAIKTLDRVIWHPPVPPVRHLRTVRKIVIQTAYLNVGKSVGHATLVKLPGGVLLPSATRLVLSTVPLRMVIARIMDIVKGQKVLTLPRAKTTTGDRHVTSHAPAVPPTSVKATPPV